MDAKQRDLLSFLKLQDTRFVIPVYQRNYDWGIEHCSQLFDDILLVGGSSPESSHFVGSVVYLQDSLLNTGTKELTIIDGQQRLTTITLLYAAIRQRLLRSGDSKGADRINRQFLVNEFAENESKLKLRPVKKDDRALRYILDGNPIDQFEDHSRLVDNFIYISARVDAIDLDILEKGISKLIFVEMSLERGKDDPQRIFQSLNSTGLDLSQADLIRNYILMDLEPRTQSRFYEDYWLTIEENCKDEDSNESRVSEYIRDFLTFKNGRAPKKRAVFDDFKKEYPSHAASDLEQVLKELTKYSDHYRRLIRPSSDNDSDIGSNIAQLHQLDVTVSFPFLLPVFEDFANDVIKKDEFIDLLECTQSYVWRRFIADLASNSLNKIFAALYQDIDRKNYLDSFKKALIRRRGNQRWPDDNEVRRDLRQRDMYNIQPKNRLYFLERLENHGQKIEMKIYENEDISIEHIFPQNPPEGWGGLTEEQRDEMERLKHTAANLSLSVFNRELGNQNFIYKRDLPEKGYRVSPLRIDKWHAELSAWNPDSLGRRFETIFKRFVTIWKFPEHLRTAASEDGQVSIFDIDELTNCTLISAMFFGITKKNPSFKELLEFVATKVFELDPDIILRDFLRTKLKVTRRKDELRSPIHVGGNYFIEGAHSGNEILRRVKLILQSSEIDDELFVQIIPNAIS